MQRPATPETRKICQYSAIQLKGQTAPAYCAEYGRPATISGFMKNRPVHPHAWIALLMSALFMLAEGFCSIFVSVYLWVNSHDFSIVCWHYLTIFGVTPISFIVAGALAQMYDRTWVYRMGVYLSIAYYTTMLTLGPSVPQYAIPLGAMLGVTWGFFFGGLNTLNYDMAVEGGRELFVGLLMTVVGVAQLISPIAAGALLTYIPDTQLAYRALFGVAVGLYVLNAIVSFYIPRDTDRRPYRIRRALFPPPEHRDWRLVLASTVTMAGAYNIFTFLLAVIMFMETENELEVGGLGMAQAFVGIIASSIAARYITRRRRGRFMIFGATLLACAGVFLSMGISVWSIVIFSMMRAAAEPFFGVPATGIRFDIISRLVEHPSQRIEYVVAWEAPLGIGRVLMMALMAALYYALPEDLLGLRIAIVILSCMRLFTVLLLLQTDVAKEDRAKGNA